MTFLYRNILSVGSTDKSSGRTHTNTHTVGQYKQENDWFYGKEHSIELRLLTSPCCSCVLACLSVAFKNLNHQTVWYKCGDKMLIKLEAIGRLNFKLQKLSNNKEENMSIFLM
jgi:hypothetical protein